ncbi:MAG: MCP four helix bundle domain-containing protein [Deltaproteobacteria bacterium]|nr:MCP four helix bundle domain-containing protein [Deltaproteobacteria bacterium]
MKWFIDLPTRTKLLLSFGVVIVFLIAVVFAAARSISGIQRVQKDILTSEFANSVDILDLKANEHAVRAAVLTMMSMQGKAEKEAWQKEISEREGRIDKVMQNSWIIIRTSPGYSAGLRS